MLKSRMELVACAVLLAGVTGCGGEHLALDAPAATAASADHADAQTTATKATTSSWTRIGSEGQWITVPANTTVRYGANGAYLQKVVSSTFQATNAFFGGDPVVGVAKSVDKLVVTTTADTTAPAGTPTGATTTATAPSATSGTPTGTTAPVAAASGGAAPAISGLSGLLQQGAAVTVRGSGFGAGKTTALLWDDFEGGAAGARIAASPAVGSWQPVNAGLTTYTTAQRYSGQKSLYAPRTASSQWANFDVSMPEARRFYQSFWFRYTYPAGATGQTKLTQIHGTYNVGDYNPGIMTGGLAGSWWASYIALENSGMYNRVSYNAEPAQATWHHYEAVLQQSGAGVADGSVTIKVDGQVVYRQSPVKTRELSGHRWNLAAFFTGMTNFGGNTETWIDDAYLNDSWARVELCEATTYAACTRKSIQPATAWQADSVVIKFNQGAFQPGQTAYLYVVEPNGTVNASGYPVVVGNQAN